MGYYWRNRRWINEKICKLDKLIDELAKGKSMEKILRDKWKCYVQGT